MPLRPFWSSPDWDVVADGSRPFHVYYDACIGDFGAAFEQEQPDGSVRPIAFISRATLDSERHWTPVDLEAGNIVWAIKRVRGYLRGTKFRVFSMLESIGKAGEHNARVQRWLELLTAFDYKLEYREGSTNRNADFLSRLPEPATKHNRSGSSSLTLVDDGGIFLIRACGVRARYSPTPGAGLGRLVSRPDSAVLGGRPFDSYEFRDFCAHGPRVRVDDLSVPPGRFVARVSATVIAVDRRRGRGSIRPAADTAFASVLATPSDGGTGTTEAPPAVTAAAQHAPSPTSTSQGADSAAITDPAASASSPPGNSAPLTALPPPDSVSNRTRRRTAADNGTAPLAVDHGFEPRGGTSASSPSCSHPAASLTAATASGVVTAPAPATSRLSGRYRFRPIETAPSL